MRLSRLVPVAFVLLVPAAAFADDWIEYAGTADFFTINFPGEPKIEETTYISEYGYSLPARIYSAESGGSRYSATVVDYSASSSSPSKRAKRARRRTSRTASAERFPASGTGRRTCGEPSSMPRGGSFRETRG